MANGFDDAFKKGLVEAAATANAESSNKTPASPLLAVLAVVVAVIAAAVIVGSKLLNGFFGDMGGSSDFKGKESGGEGEALLAGLRTRCSILPASFQEKWVTVTGVAHRFTSASIKLDGALPMVVGRGNGSDG